MRRDGNMMPFDAPGNNARVAIVDLAAADGAAAIKAAWARVGGKHAALALLHDALHEYRFDEAL